MKLFHYNENSARGRAFRWANLAGHPRTRWWFEELDKAIRSGEVKVARLVYQADNPWEVDPTLCVISKEEILKFAKKRGGYGKIIAEALGENTSEH